MKQQSITETQLLIYALSKDHKDIEISKLLGINRTIVRKERVHVERLMLRAERLKNG